METEARILLAEDDENDVVLLRYAFEKAGLREAVWNAPDGRQTIDYLAGGGRYADRAQFPMPRLVLLDLNLPLVSGLEVLEWIAARPALASLPVLVFTSSRSQGDVTEARRLGAQALLVKPLTNDGRVRVARFIKESWLEAAAPVAGRAFSRGSPQGEFVVFVAGPRGQGR